MSYSGSQPLSVPECILLFVVCFIVWSPLLMFPFWLVWKIINHAADKIIEESEQNNK